MSGRLAGQVLEWAWKDGRTITYLARVRAYGRRQKVVLGTNAEGWNRARAEIEVERIVQQIERGVWIPPSEQPEPEPAPAADPRFGAFMSEWWAGKRASVSANTVNDYEWRMSYLRHFDRQRLSEIDVPAVDRFRVHLHDQAETIRNAAAKDRPLYEHVTDRRGRTYKRRRRALSNTSINSILKLLGQILQRAVDYRLIDQNPVRVGERSARFLPRPKRVKTFVEVDEFHALLSAAGELDREARADRQALGRRAMLATLGLAGFRISELMDLRRWQVDLARGRFKLVDAKSQAGIREVEMTLYLRDELLAYLAERNRLHHPELGANDCFFPTSRGGRRDPDRFRDRILGRAVARASEHRAEAALPPLPAITPHSLRRTWAIFAATADRPPKWIAGQIGHTDPGLTFSVYQQVAARRYVDEKAIWELMRFADEPVDRAGSRLLTRSGSSPTGPVAGPVEEKGLKQEVRRTATDE